MTGWMESLGTRSRFVAGAGECGFDKQERNSGGRSNETFASV
jgi:hypothetical protein